MTCNDCHGTGLDPRDPTSACRRCGGRGTHPKSRLPAKRRASPLDQLAASRDAALDQAIPEEENKP